MTSSSSISGGASQRANPQSSGRILKSSPPTLAQARRPPPMLSVRNLVVGYGPVTALAGIDLEVAVGEIVCVIGPNGAGKTTLMKATAGLLRPRSGFIRLHNTNLPAGAVARVQAGIALVPEGRHVFAPLTVR